MKNTKEEQSVSTNVIHLPRQRIAASSKSVTDLAEWLKVKGKKHPEAMAKKITNANVLEFMEHYIANDCFAATGQWLAGQIYWLYFLADDETQNSFIEALAKRNRLPLPDGDWTPRQRLVQALYGHNPDLVDDGNGTYDSKGGKRVTMTIRTFLERAGLKKKRKHRSVESIPRKSKDLLAELFAIATPRESKMLNALIIRKYGRKAIRGDMGATRAA